MNANSRRQTTGVRFSNPRKSFKLTTVSLIVLLHLTFPSMPQFITLKNVSVHNLRGISLKIPKQQLIGFCGPSGSGKSSVAINTLFAEGQRRYLDTFSTTERGLIETPDKPDAELIEGVPPAIAITRSNEVLNRRITVGSMTELFHYFQLVFTRFGTNYCPDCNQIAQGDTPESVTDLIIDQLENQYVLIGFPWSSRSLAEITHCGQLITHGFQRAILGDRVQKIDSLPENTPELEVLVDRVRVTAGNSKRILESVETAFRFGETSCLIAWESNRCSVSGSRKRTLDDRPHEAKRFHIQLNCSNCQAIFQPLEPNQLSYNSPVGACPKCQGLGSTEEFLPERLMPDDSLSLNGGLVPVLESPEMEPLKSKLLGRYALEPNTPFNQLSPERKTEIQTGLVELLKTAFPEGIQKSNKRFASLRGGVECPQCQGTRLNPNASGYHFEGKLFSEILAEPIQSTASWFNALPQKRMDPEFRHLFKEVQSRLQYLCEVGVGYLTPIREVNSLSTGERQRVSMTNALGSN
ncbi:MAG: hypothetical protein VX438_15520, partial [Planctomycetota bacterium]|nr:hypothetical protein [Planctomycetota bacterium]